MLSRADRRLATILAADVVGYSRLMEADEAGTLDAIRVIRREVMESLGHSIIVSVDLPDIPDPESKP